MWIFTSSDHCILLVFHKSSFLVSSSDVPPHLYCFLYPLFVFPRNV